MILRSKPVKELGMLVGTALGIRLGDRLESKPRLKLVDNVRFFLNDRSGEGNAKSKTGGDAKELSTQMAYYSRAEKFMT